MHDAGEKKSKIVTTKPTKEKREEHEEKKEGRSQHSRVPSKAPPLIY
jgi:hypothetical protein